MHVRLCALIQKARARCKHNACATHTVPGHACAMYVVGGGRNGSARPWRVPRALRRENGGGEVSRGAGTPSARQVLFGALDIYTAHLQDKWFALPARCRWYVVCAPACKRCYPRSPSLSRGKQAHTHLYTHPHRQQQARLYYIYIYIYIPLCLSQRRVGRPAHAPDAGRKPAACRKFWTGRRHAPRAVAHWRRAPPPGEVGRRRLLTGPFPRDRAPPTADGGGQLRGGRGAVGSGVGRLRAVGGRLLAGMLRRQQQTVADTPGRGLGGRAGSAEDEGEWPRGAFSSPGLRGRAAPRSTATRSAACGPTCVGCCRYAAAGAAPLHAGLRSCNERGLRFSGTCCPPCSLKAGSFRGLQKPLQIDSGCCFRSFCTSPANLSCWDFCRCNTQVGCQKGQLKGFARPGKNAEVKSTVLKASNLKA